MIPIRVLVADDYPLFRQGLASLLAAQSDFEVVGEAADGLQAVELALEVKPDVIVMDLSMPVMDGLEATRRIKAEIPDTKIVIMTESDGETHLLEALESGAQGYVPQKIEPQALYGALRGVAKGEIPVSRLMAELVLQGFARRGGKPAPDTAHAAELTVRETEVLAQLAQGRSNEEVAAALAIAADAVQNHLKDILEKLHIENRVPPVPPALR